MPLSPPVDLANLSNLAETQASRAMVLRRRSRVKPLAALGAGIIAATGVLALRAFGAAPRRSRTGLIVAGSVGLGLAALGLARWQLQRYFTPTPPYEVALRSGSFELRRYPSLQIAQTTVDGHWNDALEEGFRRLARFIFGDNASAQKVAMTTPVLGTGDDDGFRVSFVLPRDILVPAPRDPRVELKNVPARMVAALRFHGRYDVKNLEAHKVELARALAERGLKPKGEAMFAGYDPPSTLPFLRRTELWVDIA